VSPEDYAEFVEAVTSLMFCCPQTHGETSHIIKVGDTVGTGAGGRRMGL